MIRMFMPVHGTMVMEYSGTVHAVVQRARNAPQSASFHPLSTLRFVRMVCCLPPFQVVWNSKSAISITFQNLR